MSYIQISTQTSTAIGAARLFATLLLITQPIASVAVEAPNTSYVAFVSQNQADLQIYEEVIRQGLDLLQGKPTDSVPPNSNWGPLNFRGIKKKFGWSLESYTFGQISHKYYLLSDVRQEVARAFNRAALGQDAVLNWQGVGRGDEVLPYGLFTVDSGNSILIPVSWLGQVRLQNKKRADITSGQSSLSGIARDANELASYGLFWFDRYVAAGHIASLIDMTGVKNGMTSLGDHRYETLQINGGREIWAIRRQRELCRTYSEQFAKDECLRTLTKAMTDFGKKVKATQRLLVASEPSYIDSPKGAWNASTRQIEFKNVSYRTWACDHPTLVCQAFAKYGEGEERADSPDSLVCYRVAGGLPRDLNFTMSEDEARRISQVESESGQRNMAGLILRVTQQPTLKSNAQKCPGSSHRIVAEGAAKIEARAIWSKRNLETAQIQQ